jgi:hypothetical protein
MMGLDDILNLDPQRIQGLENRLIAGKGLLLYPGDLFYAILQRFIHVDKNFFETFFQARLVQNRTSSQLRFLDGLYNMSL